MKGNVLNDITLQPLQKNLTNLKSEEQCMIKSQNLLN